MTTLTMKEETKLEIIQRVFRGELTVVEAGVAPSNLFSHAGLILPLPPRGLKAPDQEKQSLKNGRTLRQ